MSAAALDFAQDGGVEGRHRRPAEQAASPRCWQRAKVRVVRGLGEVFRCQDLHGRDEAAIDDHAPSTSSSRPAPSPLPLPVLPFGGNVISSTEALSLPDVPQRLAVVGAGYIGLELGIAFRKLGSEVTVIEAEDRILPRYDEQLTQPVRRWLERAGVTLHLGARVSGPIEGGALAADAKDGSALSINGRQNPGHGRPQPLAEGWGLEEMGLDMDGPFVKVDDQCRTAMRDVWAIGDLVGEPMLAHKASAQGAMVAEIIAGQRRRFEPAAIAGDLLHRARKLSPPGCRRRRPRRRHRGHDGAFPFAANGRALTLEAGEDGGFVRIVARERRPAAFSASRRSAGMSPSSPANSRMRWKWARSWKTSRHDPCASDLGRGVRRGGAPRARPRAACLTGAFTWARQRRRPMQMDDIPFGTTEWTSAPDRAPRGPARRAGAPVNSAASVCASSNTRRAISPITGARRATSFTCSTAFSIPSCRMAASCG